MLSVQILVLTFNMCTCVFLYKHHTHLVAIQAPGCCLLLLTSKTSYSQSRLRFIFTWKLKFIPKKRVWTTGIPLKRVKEYILHIYFFVLYGRFLCLRCAGWGVPLVEFGWSQPEVRQTPGGPLRPAWPLSPGRPVCPLSPGFPGWPLKALPGRPGWPVIRATVLTALPRQDLSEIVWQIMYKLRHGHWLMSSFTPNYLKVLRSWFTTGSLVSGVTW